MVFVLISSENYCTDYMIEFTELVTQLVKLGL